VTAAHFRRGGKWKLNVSRSYFIPALVVFLVWLTHSASALLIANVNCVQQPGAAPLSPASVSNLVNLGSRIQASFIPLPRINVGSSQLSEAGIERATFQTSFWNEATGFHDPASNPIFQYTPSVVAQEYYEAPDPGLPIWQPTLPPLFM